MPEHQLEYLQDRGVHLLEQQQCGGKEPSVAAENRTQTKVKHFTERPLCMFKIKSKFVDTTCMVLSNLTSSPLSDLASLHPLFVPCAQSALQDFLQQATGHWHREQTAGGGRRDQTEGKRSD